MVALNSLPTIFNSSLIIGVCPTICPQPPIPKLMVGQKWESKQLLFISPEGSLNNDAAARAILTYRNTPLPDIGLSQAQVLFHRQLRDNTPAAPEHYRLHKEWTLSSKEREDVFAKRQQIILEKNTGACALNVGTDVVVQSQGGKNAGISLAVL